LLSEADAHECDLHDLSPDRKRPRTRETPSSSVTCCAICLEDVMGELFVLPCAHAFHRPCALRWLDTKQVLKRNELHRVVTHLPSMCASCACAFYVCFNLCLLTLLPFPSHFIHVSRSCARSASTQRRRANAALSLRRPRSTKQRRTNQQRRSTKWAKETSSASATTAASSRLLAWFYGGARVRKPRCACGKTVGLRCALTSRAAPRDGPLRTRSRGWRGDRRHHCRHC
jgi:hypothetical protein